MLYIVLSETMKMVIDVAIRNIMVFPKDEVLRKKSRKVEKISKKILTLLDDMAETMYAANGAGLAAVQIGILRRVVVIDDGTGLLRLINPVIAASSGEQQEIEGCLSIPGIAGRVNRPLQVVVQALNEQGQPIELEGTGLLARAFCHEIDHLDGILFVSKAIQGSLFQRYTFESEDS
jgi:peptide deformylase